ncbi:MAG: peptidylprolyl isomerase [Acidimicrobiia bacterium]|nr:peptidylprolyl isomerase [Acidimicrobiia bacterium]
MRRLSIFVAALIVAASCSSASDTVAATVNGQEILITEILELRSSYGEDAIIAEYFRDDLSRVIFQEAVEQRLSKDFGVEIDPAVVDTRIGQFNQALETNGVTMADALGVEGATDALLRREAVTFEMRSEGIAELLRQEDLEDLVANRPQEITEVCVRHVLVATQGEAEGVAARLEGGEDFAAVASEVSLDTGTPEGDLGCSLASRYVTEFAEASLLAPLGSLFGPVETQFGFHLLIVDDRTAPTLEVVRSDPEAYLPAELAQSLWTTWFNDTIRSADVIVASEIGTWNPDAAGIIPPAGG